jgi:hypothetical protein
MSDISVPCVSLATGGLEPDLRVNYSLGMVLGLDEFRQEALYFLEKEYLHNRALHGFGTVYGLKVTTTHPGPPGEVTLTVEPGMAIDQWGRPIVLRSAQCAHLGAWLAAQERLHTGSVQSHLGISGELTVHVVASYAECLDDLVPLPGQPCSSSSQLSVPSRIRDAWNLELRWDPPAMAAWDAVRRLAKLLDSIEIVPGLAGSDEELIKAEVRALAPGQSLPLPPLPSLPSSLPPGPVRFKLPAESAAEAFDRILLVWVTEVRPLLTPELTNPEGGTSDPAVLLATITFVPTTPFSVDAPAIVHCNDPDDEGRPYLLHTQLIQELHGVRGEAAPATNARQLVTLSTALPGELPAALGAWFHLGRPVSLPAQIQVVRRRSTGSFGTPEQFSASPSGTQPQGSGFSDFWLLSPTRPLREGELVEATFDTATVLVGTPTTTLASVIASENLELLDRDTPDLIRAYTQVVIPPPIPQPPAPKASVEFVTVTTAAVSNDVVDLRIWCHPDPDQPVDAALITELFAWVFVETSAGTVPVVPPVVGDPSVPLTAAGQRNVFTLRLPIQDLQRSPFVRLFFDTSKTNVQDGGAAPIPLAEYIQNHDIRFVGWNERDAISAYVFVGAVIQGR